MTKRRNRTFYHKRRAVSKQRVPKLPGVPYLLEQGSLQDMRNAKSRTADELKYSWDYYSELALQRSQVQDELTQALIKSCTSNYQFKGWQRAVKWKYSRHPLSAVGSLTYIGGRFNTGVDVNSEVPTFPAIYLARDKDTALQETLGQTKMKNSRLTPRELALTDPQSEAIVSVSGVLEKVFDLSGSNSLKCFTDLIKNFHFSHGLKASAKNLGLSQPTVIKRPQELLNSLLKNDWRHEPSLYDVPANSQIFGYLVYQAGIEGILYPSKLTGKNCLAVFSRNFNMSSSYIELDDEPPDDKVPRKIDSSNFRLCDFSPNELIQNRTGG